MDRRDQIVNAVRAQIAIALPQATISRITRLPHAEQHPLHKVELSDETVLMLSGPAIPKLSDTAILRPSTTQAEAIVLSWLAYRRNQSSRPGSLYTDLNESRNSSSVKNMAGDDLDSFVPLLIRYFELDTGTIFLGTKGLQQRRGAYSLTAASPGKPIMLLEPPVDYRERQSLDFQSGRILRMLSDIHSPNGRFGFAAEVLSDQPVMPNGYYSDSNSWRPRKTRGYRTWSAAYERLIQEASDEASRRKISSIAFGRLHKQFERFRGFLDHVLRPRLIALYGGEDSSTLVERQVIEDNEVGMRHWGSLPELGQTTSTRVSGFQDWSNIVFGDPLMAKVLCMRPSKELIMGFTGDPEIASFSPELPSGLIDDRRHVRTRLLLYQCYWMIQEIIRKPMMPYIEGVQAATPSPAWQELSQTLLKLESTPSPIYNSARRSKKASARKRRRSESPTNEGSRRWDSINRSPHRRWSQRRRCRTP